jgi:curved DNA-binding protein CbpA
MTPYEVLGVSPGATQDEIKRAFRQKAKKCHPDVRQDKVQAEKEFKELNEAFEKAKNGWREPPQKKRWTDPGASGYNYHYDQHQREKRPEDFGGKTWSRQNKPTIDLSLEDIKIVLLNVSGPSGSERDMDAWERMVYFAAMPFPEDVYLHVSRSKSACVKLPKGTQTGQKFRFTHPDYPNIKLTIIAIHDKYKGL